MFSLKPKEDKFFELFAQSTRLVRQGAYIQRELMENYNSIDQRMNLVSDLEHEADELNDAIIDKLNQTFITPLDREDIYALATMLDDLVDYVQGTVERMMLYRTGKPTPAAVELADLLTKSTEELVNIFDLLKNIKGNQEKILEHTRKIVDLESEGDSVYRKEVAHLFANCPDPIYVIKWKEVLAHLEDSLDHCEKIADIIRGVVMKYA